jgi:hypothetical protein
MTNIAAAFTGRKQSLQSAIDGVFQGANGTNAAGRQGWKS